MSDPVLRQLFRAQAGRLGRALTAQRDEPEADLAQIGHLLHTLKAAALSADEAALANQCHAVESALQLVGSDGWRPALATLLAMLDISPASSSLTLTQLQMSLRGGFAASLQLAGLRGVLKLDIAEAWLVHAEVLLDALPHLLRNAVAHGGEAATVRVAAGKPEALQVRVRGRVLASARPPRLTLVVTDDGRGTARPAAMPDLLAGRGWGVAAVRAAVATLPAGQLRYRGMPGRGSAVRITCLLSDES